MNEIIHFYTGYLIALIYYRFFQRSSNKINEDNSPFFRYDGFLTFFAGISALLPDFDGLLGIKHGGITHTIIGTSLLALIFSILIFSFVRDFFKILEVKFTYLFLLSWISAMSHLFLDTFTHQNFDPVGCSTLHIYFWPIWDQSFHLDCLFGWSYLTRVLIEWAFYVPLVLIYLLSRWAKNKENMFKVFLPSNWWKCFDSKNSLINIDIIHLKKIKTRLLIIWLFILILFGFMLAGYLI